MYNNREYQLTNITGATTTNIFTGRGTLGKVIINDTGSLGTITINDTGSPTVAVATIRLSGSAAVSIPYELVISGGLQIVTSNSPNITVTWMKA